MARKQAKSTKTAKQEFRQEEPKASSVKEDVAALLEGYKVKQAQLLRPFFFCLFGKVAFFLLEPHFNSHINTFETLWNMWLLSMFSFLVWIIGVLSVKRDSPSLLSIFMLFGLVNILLCSYEVAMELRKPFEDVAPTAIMGLFLIINALNVSVASKILFYTVEVAKAKAV